MNWSRIKTVMILILLAANVFLAYTIISRYLNINYIDEESLVTLKSVLADSGVDFDLEIIDRKRPSMYTYELEKDDEYQTDMAVNLSRSTVSGQFQVPDEVSVIPMENEVSVIPMEDGSRIEFRNEFLFWFSYTDTQDKDKIKYYGNIFSSFVRSSNYGVEIKNTSDFEKIILDFLTYSQSSEDSTEKGRIGVTNVKAFFSDENKCYIVTADQTLDGVRIVLSAKTDSGQTAVGNTVMFIINQGENEVSAATGTWCFMDKSERAPSQLYDQMNILFNEKKRAESNASKNDYGEIDDEIMEQQLFSISSENTDFSDFSENSELSENNLNEIVPVSEFIFPYINSEPEEYDTSDTESTDDINYDMEADAENKGEENLEDSDGRVVITSLKLCYCLYQLPGSNHIIFIPGWEITRDDGSLTIYNGMNGTIYTNNEGKATK